VVFDVGAALGAHGQDLTLVEGERSVSYDEPVYVDEGATGKDACKKRAVRAGFRGMMVAFLKAFHAFNQGDSGE
jgi:hypothetical protein